MSTGTTKRPLELLIRKRGSSGDSTFEIKVIPSDRAFLRMRPARRVDIDIEENVIEEADGPVHVLHLLDRDRHMRLSAAEYAVWQLMDGRHSVQELATILVIEHGCFDFDVIRHTLVRMRNAGLIVDDHRPGLFRARTTETGAPVRSLARRIAEFDHRWEGVDPIFRRLHRAIWPLFSRPALVGAVLLGVIGLGLYVDGRGRLAGSMLTLPTWGRLLLFLAVVPLFMVVHELAHGVACKALGRQVRAVGLTMIDYVMPGIYVDVTDMSMASRAARIIVAVAGPLANLVMAAVLVLLARMVQHPALAAVLWVCAEANLALVAYTLWPFWGVREDGYDALSEALGQPELRGRSVGWLVAKLRGREPGAPIRPLRAIAYLAGLAASWAGVAVALLWWLWRSASG